MPRDAGVRLDHIVSKFVLGEGKNPLPYSRNINYAQTLLEYWCADGGGRCASSFVDMREMEDGLWYYHTVVLIEPTSGRRVEYVGEGDSLALAICRAFIDAYDLTDGE